MAQHILSLEAPDTMNKCILRVVDTSEYAQDVTVSCPILWVTVPGFGYSVQFTESTPKIVAPGFIHNFTACDLEIQTDNCGTEYSDLPDGIYSIKYSVSPNEEVYAEYNHLRITEALYMYKDILCDLDVAACDPPADVKKDLEQLRLIKMYLESAKAQVEFCHRPNKGMDLYNYALKLLEKFNCSSCA